MKTYVLPYGKGNQTVDLPEDHVLYDLHGPGTNAIEDEEQAVRDALRHPVGSSPLEDIIEPSDTVWRFLSITKAFADKNYFTARRRSFHGAAFAGG